MVNDRRDTFNDSRNITQEMIPNLITIRPLLSDHGMDPNTLNTAKGERAWDGEEGDGEGVNRREESGGGGGGVPGLALPSVA